MKRYPEKDPRTSMKRYPEKDLHLVTNSFVFDPVDAEKDDSIWYKISENEVIYNLIKSHCDVDCLILNRDGMTCQTSTSFTGKVAVPLLNANEVDFAQAMEELLVAVSHIRFKENPMSFDMIIPDDIQAWVDEQDTKWGAFYVNEDGYDRFKAPNVKKLPLPNDIIMFLPTAECVGILPIRSENEELVKFGAVMFHRNAKFAHVNVIEIEGMTQRFGDARLPTEPGNWWRVGMLQSVRFYASADDFIPKVQGGFIGVVVNECEKPSLVDGLNVFYSEFAHIGEPTPNVSTHFCSTG